MNPTDRWTDERLDDLANTLWATREVPERVAVLESALENMRGDVHDCKTGIDKLHEARAQERRDRKRDFQWVIGSVLASASIIVAALAVFLS